MDDDSESVITKLRDIHFIKILLIEFLQKSHKTLSTSDKIDKIVTFRFLLYQCFISM